MIKRVIEISVEPLYLAVKQQQLLLKKPHGGDVIASIPCEDIGMIVIDHPLASYSHYALMTLLEHGAVILVCGRNHHPAGLLLPFSSHKEIVWRLDTQINASKPLRKNLWKQIVAAKIRSQATNLESNSPACKRLLNLARNVHSDDRSNTEAQAARIYWSNWLGKNAKFRRDPDGEDPVNGMLNYGYAVLRAAVARSLVISGLQPALGLHHHNRSNPFCLADDLLEPLRPIVDRCVRRLHKTKHDEVDREAKSALLGLLNTPVMTGEQKGPLQASLRHYAASLVQCLMGEETTLMIPLSKKHG